MQWSGIFPFGTGCLTPERYLRYQRWFNNRKKREKSNYLFREAISFTDSSSCLCISSSMLMSCMVDKSDIFALYSWTQASSSSSVGLPLEHATMREREDAQFPFSTRKRASPPLLFQTSLSSRIESRLSASWTIVSSPVSGSPFDRSAVFISPRVDIV